MHMISFDHDLLVAMTACLKCRKVQIRGIGGYVGSRAVREELRTRFSGIPDVQYKDDTHFVSGETGVSQWALRGTSADGQPDEVRGCDFFTFENGKIAKTGFLLEDQGKSRSVIA